MININKEIPILLLVADSQAINNASDSNHEAHKYPASNGIHMNNF